MTTCKHFSFLVKQRSEIGKKSANLNRPRHFELMTDCEIRHNWRLVSYPYKQIFFQLPLFYSVSFYE